jgi:hypothetical protein
MATQGLVSVVRDDKVILKVAVGCDGYRALALARRVIAEGIETADALGKAAESEELGCSDCRVIMDTERTYFPVECHESYRKTFGEPFFNPRWDSGECEYAYVADLSRKKVFNKVGWEIRKWR